MTTFAQITQMLATVLAQSAALAGVDIVTNRKQFVTKALSRSVAICLHKSVGNNRLLGSIRWESTLTLACCARAAESAQAASHTDDLLASVWALLASMEGSQAGFEITIDPSVEWDFVGDAAKATLHLTAIHDTNTTDLLTKT